MKIALNEAKKSFKKGEIPIGCVIVCGNKVIAKAHNLKEHKHNCLFHAELIAINKVSKKLKRWRLNDCEIYVTMQPCPMCASAIKQSRINKLYYGVENNNNMISNLIFDSNDNNSSIIVEKSILEDECKSIVQNFFQSRRKLRNK